MPGFDDFGKMISDFATTTVKKTKDLTETGKLKLQINSLKTDLDEQYKKLGRLFFEADGEMDRGDCPDAFYQIESLLQQIEELSGQVNELKNIAVCPNCGTKMELGVSYCSNCGAKMPMEAPDENDFSENADDTQDA